MFLLWFFGGFVALLLVGGLVLFFVGRHLRYKPYTVTVPSLPPSFDGFRIAVISDLHDRRFGEGNKVLSQKILKANPDLVVMAGDMHESPHDPQPFYTLIRDIAAQVPVTYTEGNHDLRNLSSPRYGVHLQQISQSGATVLLDSALPLARNGQLLMLYGQSWRSIKSGEQPCWESSCPTVAVCHDPQQFDRLQDLPELMISGHVHGGILRLPFLGPVFAPGDGAPLHKRLSLRFFFPKYSRGLYHKGDRTLALTQGLGFSVLPIRFIPPEIMILTLKSGKKMNIS